MKRTAVVLLGAVCVTGCFERGFEEEVLGMQVGTPRTEVINYLGQPDDSSKEFRLGQRDGFEEQYEAAAESGSVTYSFWHRKVDYVCAVGFDSRDRVAYRACGGT